MNQLTTKTNQTLTSIEVAEMVEKEHKNVLADIRKYSEELGVLKIQPSDFFVPSTYINSQNKEQPCFEVTKKGCEFIANKLTGIKGTEFTAKYINRFHDMESKLNTPLSLEQIMRIQLSMVDDVAERVDKLENNMTIDYGQQKVLERLVSASVIKALGGKDTNAYKEIGKKVFKECNRDIQDHFDVNSRSNVPKLKFDDACAYIKLWEPCTNTRLMIKDCNNQISLD